MTWVKLDDHFDEHPKIAAVGPLGIALWVCGLAYCNRNLTDGFIPGSIARRLCGWEFDFPDGSAATVLIGGERNQESIDQIGFVPDGLVVPNMLVAVGLWENVPGGFQVHDYTDFQPSKAQIEAERQQKASAGRAGGLARAQAESKQPLSTRLSRIQAESKPVPVPEGYVVNHSPFPDPVPDPVLSAVSAKPAATSKRKPLTDEQRAKVIADYAFKVADLEGEIAFAMQHTSRLKSTDENLYLRNWLNRTTKNAPREYNNGRSKFSQPTDENEANRQLREAGFTSTPTTAAELEWNERETDRELAIIAAKKVGPPNRAAG